MHIASSPSHFHIFSVAPISGCNIECMCSCSFMLYDYSTIIIVNTIENCALDIHSLLLCGNTEKLQWVGVHNEFCYLFI